MKARTHLDWVEPTSATSGFSSPVIDLTNRNESLSFQVVWDSGLLGTFKWQASIFPGQWEDFVSCEAVNFIVDGTETTLSNIVALPNNYLLVGYLRLVFSPDSASAGTFKVAQRVCPN